MLRGVIFDMDGTLTVPNLDFKEMYERCGVSRSDDLLTAIAAMPVEQAARANAVIDEMEAEGRRTLRLEPGAVELCRWLRAHSLPVALVTRNSRLSVDHLHTALCEPAGMPRFDPAISRDDGGIPPKPDPTALLGIAERWALPPESLLMVGDSPSNDVAFGKAAGAHAALVDSGRSVEEGTPSGGADLIVASLAELPRAIWTRFAIDGPTGALVLPKYTRPEPGSAASVAAAAGNVSALAGMSAAELGAHDDDARSPTHGNTPLIWAADAGHAAAVHAILSKLDAGDVGDVNARGFLGATAVARAARGGHTDALSALCAVPGIDLNMPNAKLQSALHFAAFKRHKAAVSVLLEAGASTRALDRKGRTPAEDTDVAEIREMIKGWNK